jgi:hypothetical protein
VGGRKCVIKRKDGRVARREARQPVFILAEVLEVRCRRGGLRGGRLARSGNVKSERADAKPELGAPNPSGTGAPQVEARSPSDRLLYYNQVG